MGDERRAPPGALNTLIRLIPTKKSGHNSAICDFCMKATVPPHVYLTCPDRPCYLCRAVGHSQVECPFRSTAGAPEAARKRLTSGGGSTLRWNAARELGLLPRAALPPGKVFGLRQCEAKVVASVRRVHKKRVTALEVLSTACWVKAVSADKSGEVAMWSFGNEIGARERKVAMGVERMQIHRCNVTGVQFRGGEEMFTSSADGFVCRTRLELFGSEGGSEKIVNMNPGGWTGNGKNWRMAYGMCLHGDGGEGGGGGLNGCFTAGDDKGNMLTMDVRAAAPTSEAFKGHKDKVQWMDGNNFDTRLFASASNDRTVRVWDVRRLGNGAELCCIDMRNDGGSIPGVEWSRGTGTKLLVTAQPNKLKVWNNVHRFGVSEDTTGQNYPAPDHDIVHAHHFNRYLTNSRATWDPKDPREELFLCGRFLGEAYTVAGQTVLLHPVDLFSARTGELVASLVDGSMENVCVVNRFHPSEDAIISGSSQHLYMWAPPQEEKDDIEKKAEEEEVPADETAAQRKRRVGAQVPGTSRSTRPRQRARRT